MTSGRSQKAQGAITLSGADTACRRCATSPWCPRTSRPNQDSIHDRVSISYYLTKEAERSQVYLVPARAQRPAAAG